MANEARKKTTNSSASTGTNSSRSSSSSSRPRARKPSKAYITKSGQTIKIHRNMSEKVAGWRDNKAQHRAIRLAGRPKSRVKRFFFRLKPTNLYRYWFSREGAIMALKVIGVGIIVVFVMIVGAFAYFRKDLPAVNNVYGQNLGGSISYYDRTGKILLWQDYDAVKRLPVAGNQISPYMGEASVAIEDKNFYHEGAFDVGAIFRSAYDDIFSSGGQLYGGSTITEQLVKLNENWTGQRTIATKVKEVILASELEKEYSKSDILTAYLNIAPYGGVDYGVQVAAEDYFGEAASQLTLPQSAFLAAIPQAPDIYSPDSPDFDQQLFTQRQQYVLYEMEQQHMITAAQYKSAKTVNVLSELKPQASKYTNIIAPYFVLTAKQQLENQFGASTVQRGGWKVITTLDMNQQNEAQSLVAANYANVVRNNGDEEAIVVENVPTAQVTALVGGVNFNNPDYGQINYATIPIEPGSSFKLYDYTALINDNDNVGAGSVLYDIQQVLPGYPCTDKAEPLQGGNCLEDYDFRYPGPETIRYAMAGSRNVPAVKAMLINGEQKTINTAIAMGLKSGYDCYANTQLTVTTTCYGSAAIGDGAYLKLDEHVNGFATDSRLGSYIPQTYILNITDSTGKVIYNWTQPKPDQVVRADASYIIDNIISDPRASYLPGSCTATNCTPLADDGYKFQRVNGWDVAIKTGTTNDNYDGLMMSMTTQYAVGTWVGYHTREVALVAGQMEYLTEPLARGMITYLIGNNKPDNWVQPPGIKVLPAYVQTAHVGLGSIEPGPSTDLYPSWYVQPTASDKSYTIDQVSGMLATSCTPALAKKVISADTSANIFSIDTFVNSGTSATGTAYNTTESDDVHQCGEAQPSVTFNNPTPAAICNDQNSGTCETDITISAGAHPLSSASFPLKVNMLVNGQSEACNLSPAISTSNPPPSATETCSFAYSGSGNVSLQAQIIDSVLDSGTSSTQSIPGIPTISPLTTASVNNNTFSWTSSGSTDSYTLSVSNNGGGCSASGGSTSCTDNTQLTPGASYTAQVTDTTSREESPSITFTAGS